MSYDGQERRRWWMRPWRLLRSVVAELGNEPVGRWHHMWRDFVPLLAIAVAAFAVFGVEGKVDDATVNAKVAKVEATTAKRVAAAQKDGRRVAVGITCGALMGVEDAGRLVLTDRLPGTERFRRPSSPGEKRVRRAYAKAYNRVISERIRAEAGVAAAGIVGADGSVDCDALRLASATAPPP